MGVYPCTSQLTMYEYFSFSAFSPVLVIVSLVDYSHALGCEVVSYCSFDFHFLMTDDVEHIFFLCFLVICISLEKCVFISFVHFLN